MVYSAINKMLIFTYKLYAFKHKIQIWKVKQPKLIKKICIFVSSNCMVGEFCKMILLLNIYLEEYFSILNF